MTQTFGYKKLSLLGAALLSAALLGGCASTSDLSKVQATADAAKAEADKAMAEVNRLAEKIDRMFKKTMQK